jgi:DNA-binding NtrC family response regulator
MAREKFPPNDQWQTENTRRETARFKLRRAVLVVLDGEDKGHKVALETGELTIGSGAAADLTLEERSVSRLHAKVTVEEGRHVLRDLGSTNGTRLNGAEVREAILNEGDVVEIGRIKLRFGAEESEVRVGPSLNDRFGPVYGSSLAMRRVFGVVERVAPSASTLLILGETGTGKDLVARAVHAASPRAAKPFVVVDCSTLSPELAGSELFGHVPGAFTGAVQKRVGAFEAAHRGTVFLDEIGELPADVQAKLLRVLESREVRPVGSTAPVAVDVRVLAATHRDLKAMVAEKTFREDLFYRLSVVSVTLPPLRERREDIRGLAESLFAGLEARDPRPRLSEAALTALGTQSWPGNVRELRNVLERSALMSLSPVIEAEDLIFTESMATPGVPSIPDAKLADLEREAIRSALERAGGNQKEAARLLGIHRNSLRLRMKRYGLLDEDR